MRVGRGAGYRGRAHGETAAAGGTAVHRRARTVVGRAHREGDAAATGARRSVDGEVRRAGYLRRLIVIDRDREGAGGRVAVRVSRGTGYGGRAHGETTAAGRTVAHRHARTIVGRAHREGDAAATSARRGVDGDVRGTRDLRRLIVQN